MNVPLEKREAYLREMARELVKFSDIKKHKMAAIVWVVSGGFTFKILGFGTNARSSPSPLIGDGFSVHAEIMATRRIAACGGGLVVSVFRFKANGQLATSKPCNSCSAALRRKGFFAIEYFDGTLMTTRTL